MRATRTRQFTGIAIAALCAIALGAGTAAQATDPLVGTWKLDVAKSTYKPGPTPKSATAVITAVGEGIKVAVDAAMPDGTAMKWGYTSARDGKEVPVTGHPAYDAATVTKTSPTEGTIVYSKAGKPVATAKTAVAKDGKTMTVTTTGPAINNLAVFTKS
ncbi:MAG: hypothetical protein ABIX28_16325 [Vicinamibacterales bacterium]